MNICIGGMSTQRIRARKKRTCTACNVPKSFATVAKYSEHYRTHHQSAVRIVDCQEVRWTVRRTSDNVFRCPTCHASNANAKWVSAHRFCFLWSCSKATQMVFVKSYIAAKCTAVGSDISTAVVDSIARVIGREVALQSAKVYNSALVAAKVDGLSEEIAAPLCRRMAEAAQEALADAQTLASLAGPADSAASAQSTFQPSNKRVTRHLDTEPSHIEESTLSRRERRLRDTSATITWASLNVLYDAERCYPFCMNCKMVPRRSFTKHFRVCNGRPLTVKERRFVSQHVIKRFNAPTGGCLPIPYLEKERGGFYCAACHLCCIRLSEYARRECCNGRKEHNVRHALVQRNGKRQSWFLVRITDKEPVSARVAGIMPPSVENLLGPRDKDYLDAVFGHDEGLRLKEQWQRLLWFKDLSSVRALRDTAVAMRTPDAQIAPLLQKKQRNRSEGALRTAITRCLIESAAEIAPLHWVLKLAPRNAKKRFKPDLDRGTIVTYARFIEHLLIFVINMRDRPLPGYARLPTLIAEAVDAARAAAFAIDFVVRLLVLVFTQDFNSVWMHGNHSILSTFLIHFSVSNSGNLIPIGRLTEMASAICYCSKIMCYASVRGITDVREQNDEMVRLCGALNGDGVGAIESVYQVLRKIRAKGTATPQCHIQPLGNGDVLLDGVTVTRDALMKARREAMREAQDMIAELSEGVPMSVVDMNALSNEANGWVPGGMMQHPDHYMDPNKAVSLGSIIPLTIFHDEARRQQWCKLDAATNALSYIPERAAEYQRRYDRLLDVLMFLVMVSGGMPPRGAEVSHFLVANSQTMIRTVFVGTGAMYLFPPYNKIDHVSEGPVNVVRVLDADLAHMLCFVYLVLRPFVVTLGERTGFTCAAYFSHMFARKGCVLKAREICDVFRELWAKYTACPISLRQYRHYAVYVGRRLANAAYDIAMYNPPALEGRLELGMPRSLGAMMQAAVEEVYANMAGHLVYRQRVSYALVVGMHPGRPDYSVMFNCENASRLWHMALTRPLDD